MIDGLDYIDHFVPVTQGKDCDFMMVSEIRDLASIESHGISHQYTGTSNWKFLMTGMSMAGMKDGEASEKPMIRVKSLKDFSFLFKKFYFDVFLEIGTETYMVSNLIIESRTVVKEIQMPEDMYIGEPELVPFFDLEEFPYIIFTCDGPFYMVNIKEETVQKIVEASG